MTRWAFFYGHDGRLLLVCPFADERRWWDSPAVARVEVA